MTWFDDPTEWGWTDACGRRWHKPPRQEPKVMSAREELAQVDRGRRLLELHRRACAQQGAIMWAGLFGWCVFAACFAVAVALWAGGLL